MASRKQTPEQLAAAALTKAARKPNSAAAARRKPGKVVVKVTEGLTAIHADSAAPAPAAPAPKKSKFITGVGFVTEDAAPEATTTTTKPLPKWTGGGARASSTASAAQYRKVPAAGAWLKLRAGTKRRELLEAVADGATCAAAAIGLTTPGGHTVSGRDVAFALALGVIETV